MKISKEIKIKIYLKNKIKPFTVTLDNERQLDLLTQSLEKEEIVKFGPLIFAANNFNFLIVED